MHLMELSKERSLYWAALTRRAKFEGKDIWTLLKDSNISEDDVKDPDLKLPKLKAKQKKSSETNKSKKVSNGYHLLKLYWL